MTKIIDAINMHEQNMISYKKGVNSIQDKLGYHYKPKFVIINASDDKGNERYIKNKVEEGERAGLEVIVEKLDESCTNEDVLKIIKRCNFFSIPVILQLPVFDHIDAESLIKEIDYKADADGFSTEWLGRVAVGDTRNVVPATPKGVMNIIDYHNIEVEGKVAIVIGRSNHVGKPIANLLISRGATVISANSKTKNLGDLVKQSDIVVSCVGKQNLIKSSDVKDGAVLIGVGFTYVNGKQILDFDIDDIVNNSNASMVTNRINCTGKATVGALIDNVIKLYKISCNIE